MNNIPIKFNIEKDAQELKLYMFTVQSGPIKFDLPEDFKTIIAYNDIDALNEAKKDYLPGVQLFVKKRGQIEIKKIVDSVNFQPVVPQKVEFLIAPPPSKEKTIQDFIHSMLLISDKFVIDKTDRELLKSIINKIKINSHVDTCS